MISWDNLLFLNNNKIQYYHNDMCIVETSEIYKTHEKLSILRVGKFEVLSIISLISWNVSELVKLLGQPGFSLSWIIWTSY